MIPCAIVCSVGLKINSISKTSSLGLDTRAANRIRLVGAIMPTIATLLDLVPVAKR